jgi:hypothetical protein
MHSCVYLNPNKIKIDFSHSYQTPAYPAATDYSRRYLQTATDEVTTILKIEIERCDAMRMAHSGALLGPDAVHGDVCGLNAVRLIHLRADCHAFAVPREYAVSGLR